MSTPDYYAVLNIPRNASTAEIVQAYRTMISAYQSDSLAAYSLFDEEEMNKIRLETEEAYQALCQIEKRRAYDASLPTSSYPETPESDKPLSDL